MCSPSLPGALCKPRRPPAADGCGERQTAQAEQDRTQRARRRTGDRPPDKPGGECDAGERATCRNHHAIPSCRSRRAARCGYDVAAYIAAVARIADMDKRRHRAHADRRHREHPDAPAVVHEDRRNPADKCKQEPKPAEGLGQADDSEEREDGEQRRCNENRASVEIAPEVWVSKSHGVAQPANGANRRFSGARGRPR